MTTLCTHEQDTLDRDLGAFGRHSYEHLSPTHSQEELR